MKIAHVGISVNGLCEAFHRNATEYKYFEWSDYVNSGATDKLCALLRNTPCDITFFHLQQPVPKEIIEAAHGFKINWTWDLRRPTPQWYIDYAPLFDLTLVPSREDALIIPNAKYIPPHVDTNFYKPSFWAGEEAASREIVFIGNDFGDRFPNGQERRDMIKLLQDRYKTFYAYGYNQPRSIPVGQRGELSAYSDAKIAINHNQITADGYTSDRMMRSMACGVVTLTSAIPGGIPGFVEGHNYYSWSNFGQLINRIDELLEDEVLRSLVGANGHRLMSESFSWDCFVEKIIAYSEAK